jgi:membrane-associated phospholipid phosphatase
LAGATICALCVAGYGGVIGLDRWVFGVIPRHRESTVFEVVAGVGAPYVVAVVAVVAALSVRARDRARAVACLVGPLLAGLLTEFVLKPLVDGSTHSAFQFPSGHTTGAAAIAAVIVIVAPRTWRPYVATAGVLLSVASCVAVVVLRWHTATDAAAGVLIGLGSVLLVDGLVHVRGRR